MNQSINCLTVSVVSPVSILWRLTPGSWKTQISRCDSKNSLTRFRFSTFPHLSYAVSQALLVTSHPFPRGPAAPSACDLIQNHYCTPHLTEVYTQPPPSAPETPPPPTPPPLALKNLQLHNTDLCFPLFRKVTVLWCRVETHSLQLTENPLKVPKSCIFSYFPQVLYFSVLEPLGQNSK